jgi:hypothetical protein
MKMALKCKKKQWAIAHKKQWAIAQEKQWAIAHENDKFFCHSSLRCTDCHIPCKSPRTKKQWALAHKNGPETQKR